MIACRQLESAKLFEIFRALKFRCKKQHERKERILMFKHEILRETIILALVVTVVAVITVHFSRQIWSGYPASQDLLVRQEVYEVVGVIPKGGSNYLALLRERNEEIRLFSLKQPLRIGEVYKSTGTNLILLMPVKILVFTNATNTLERAR